MIFFLYGKDTFRSHEKLKEIRNRFFEKIDPDKMNAAVLDGETLNINEFREKVATASFFATKRLVAIENFLLKNKDEEIIKYLGKYLKDK